MSSREYDFMFSHSVSVWLASLFLISVSVLALLGPFLGLDATLIHVNQPTIPPFQSIYWFGTDDLGRDLFARIVVGARISLAIGFATALFSSIFGTIYGTISAFYGGVLDVFLMRVVDVIYSLPGLMVVILFSLFFGRGVSALVIALSLFSWPDTARMIRGQILVMKKLEFVEAYQSLGGSTVRLFTRQFLPNMWGLILLTVTITVPRAILTESTLSFIGLGVEPPLSSWGTLASEGWQLVRVAPYMIVWPALFIFITMLSLNIVAEALRCLYDPKVGIQQAKR